MRVNLIDKNPFIAPVAENAKVIIDNSVQNLKFNVMHEKDVEEKLTFKKYIIKGNKIERIIKKRKLETIRPKNKFKMINITKPKNNPAK